MKRMRTYFIAFLVLCLVLAAHIIGLKGMYLAFPPYDILMHIFGGIGVGLAVCAAIKLHGEKIVHKRRAIMIGVVFFGILWELFEMYSDLTSYPLWTAPYYIDTAKDLINGLIGGSLVAFLCQIRRK